MKYLGLLITTRTSHDKGEDRTFEAECEDHVCEADGDLAAKAELNKQVDLRQRVERAHDNEKAIVRYVFRGTAEPAEESKD